MMFPNVFKSWNMAVMQLELNIKHSFPQWLITRLFYKYFHMKIALNLNRPGIDKNACYEFITIHVKCLIPLVIPY